jgi:hypothetical protein
MSRRFFLSPSAMPCVAPPWGELVAVHADTGETAWRTTLGDLGSIFTLTPGSPVGALNLGGPVTTSTGLVFIGATIDRFIRAFETRSGCQVLGCSIANRRARHAACVHDGERARDGRDRGWGLRFAVVDAGHDARGFRTGALKMTRVHRAGCPGRGFAAAAESLTGAPGNTMICAVRAKVTTSC